MLSKRLYGAALMAAVATPTMLGGCSAAEDNPLCCNEFKVGATIGANIGGGAESKVAVQAVADFAAIASAAVDDITAGCRSMAQDLDADKTKQDAAEANNDKRARMDAWCKLAVETIASFKASAGITIKVDFQPPKCEASVSAKANCQAQCSGGAKCDLKANPPKCTGGKLEVSCKGGCTAEAGATVACEGGCTGECKGDCTAEGGVKVDCQGKCEGTCSAGGAAGGSGVQADGSCKGQCQGTCKAEATAPAVKCQGSCKGSCSAKCEAKAGASVKCDGKCDGEFEPLKCEGGKLEGGCKVEAKCDANCDASVSAKAECTPPRVAFTLQATGAAEGQIAAFTRLKATLEANLPLVFAFKARLETMAELAVNFTGNIKAVTDIKVACIPPLVLALTTAVDDVTASVSASASVAGSIN